MIAMNRPNKLANKKNRKVTEMLHKRLICVVLVLLAACAGQVKENIDPRWAATTIGAILNNAHSSGSLEYWGSCDSNGGSTDFPKLRLPEDVKGASAVQVLREMFASDLEMLVTLDQGGEIRMVERGVPRDLLDVKIAHLSFNMLGSPTEALWEVLRAPEVKAFMKRRKLGPILPDAFSYSIPSYPSQPISGDLDNATVSEVLDYILKTYPGFWTYENCKGYNGERTVLFGFFPRVPPSVAKFP